LNRIHKSIIVFSAIISFFSYSCQNNGQEIFFNHIKSGNVGELHALLKENPSLVRLRDEYGKTPLHILSCPSCTKTIDVRHLIERKKPEDLIEIFINNILVPFINKTRQNIAELFLAYGADIDAVDKDGNTPLHSATDILGGSYVQANKHMIHFLLLHGADTSCKNMRGKTPFERESAHEKKIKDAQCLFKSIRKGKIIIPKETSLEILMNLQDQEGNTALQIAMNLDHKENVLELLTYLPMMYLLKKNKNSKMIFHQLLEYAYTQQKEEDIARMENSDAPWTEFLKHPNHPDIARYFARHSFFMAYHPRLGEKSLANVLPKEIFAEIIGYL